MGKKRLLYVDRSDIKEDFTLNSSLKIENHMDTFENYPITVQSYGVNIRLRSVSL